METNDPMIEVTLYQFELISKLRSDIENLSHGETMKGNMESLPRRAVMRIRNSLSSLVEQLSIIESYNTAGTFYVNDLKNGEQSKPYNKIPHQEFHKASELLERFREKNHAHYTSDILTSILFQVESTFDEIKKLNNIKTPFLNDRLEGLTNQLLTRQNEINKQAKKVLSELEERSESATANIAREAQRQSNQLEIHVKELHSELQSQLETAASNAKIDLKSESSKLGRELTEEITLIIDSSLEKKQKEIHDRNDRHAKLLLEKVESDVSNLSNKVNEQIEDFCVLNDALRRTLNFVASDALADTSIKQAEQEKKTADTLRGWGVAWLIASIGLFLFTFDYDKLVDENNVPQYTLILLRSFFLIVGITPGFYLLRESARHRTDERRYRQKGIQLATIDGYFAEFEDSERNKVKKDLSKHYFHGAEHFVDSSSVDHIQSKYDKIFDKVVSSKQLK
ncbi:TPA: hypothetical protein ACPJZ4_000419 [Vibrio diabolicus]